jgi:hypothetical protein
LNTNSQRKFENYNDYNYLYSNKNIRNDIVSNSERVDQKITPETISKIEEEIDYTLGDLS